MNVQETKEQLIAELIRLAFAEDIGADRERRRRIGRCRNG